MGVISSLGDAPGNPVIDKVTCTVCGLCVTACPVGVLTRSEEGIRADNSTMFGCIACGQCMMACPTGSVAVTGRRLSPDDLVDLPPREQRATVEQLEALLLARRSIRHFLPDELPRELLERVVADATMAPMGIPPWEVGVTVFHGRARVRELAQDTADGYAGLLRILGNPPGKALFRLVTKKTAWQQFESFILPLGRAIVEGRRQGEDLALYDAPAALLFHVSPYADGADAFIACTYAMVAAEALGLGSCMIGCVAPVIGRRKELLRKYGLPAGHAPKIVLILGYPAVAFEKAVRRPFQSVCWY
jgi:nitroreductase/NAD-dependent dihydropyrimidine dehydrogenase PreA subunit